MQMLTNSHFKNGNAAVDKFFQDNIKYVEATFENGNASTHNHIVRDILHDRGGLPSH